MSKFYRCIIIFLISFSFIFHDVVWAFNGRVKEDTLSPVSAFLEDVSHLSMEMAGIARGILAGIERYNKSSPSSPILSAGDLYTKLLERDEYQIASDLRGQGVNIVTRAIGDISTLPDRIEFIGQKFTLTFTDKDIASLLPAGIVKATLPGTNIVIALNERLGTEETGDLVNGDAHADGAERHAGTLCPGEIIPDAPGWSPFIVKDGVPGVEIKIDDKNVQILLDGSELFRMSLTDWQLLKEGRCSLQVKTWINTTKDIMLDRVLKHVYEPGNSIRLTYDKSGINLNIIVEKELLIALFGGEDDMSMAIAEFMDRLSGALNAEIINHADIGKLQGKKRIKFVLVDKYSHLAAYGNKNRVVILHRALQDIRIRDKDVFDAYIEMLIAHELGLHEIKGIRPEDADGETERADSDVNNFFRALLLKQKNYSDVEPVLSPILGADNEFLSSLRKRFEMEGAYLPATIKKTDEKKIGELFKEIVEQNLKGTEIIDLFFEGDESFSRVQNFSKAIIDKKSELFSSLEKEGRLDAYIFKLAKFWKLIGLPSEEQMAILFPDYPNLAKSLGRIYSETLPNEWKDKYKLEMELVAAHACRVTRLALLIARSMGDEISPEDEKIIALSALLHDIGKGKVIDIISSPRKLTQDEFERVNKHAEESITQLDNLLNTVLKTEPYKGKAMVSLPKKVLGILLASTDFRKAIRYHHTVGKLTGDSEGKSRLIAEILMAADVLDALLDASRPYILQGGDIKGVGDALDILNFMKDRATGKPLIRDKIRATLKELDTAKGTEFVDVVTSTQRFPILYTALVLATILPDGIGPVLDSAKNDEEKKIYEAILEGIAYSNLDIRKKVRLTQNIGKIAEQITGYRDAIVKEGVSIDTIALDRLLVINSGLRLDLTREAREKIENGGVVILMGERGDIADAYKILMRRLKAAGKLQFERNILAIEMDKNQHISIMPARRVIVAKEKSDEFLKVLGEGSSFQNALNTLFGEDAWIYQYYFEEFVQKTYYELEGILTRLLDETNKDIESRPPDSHWLTKETIAMALKSLMDGKDTNWLNRILVWHLLVKLGKCEEPNGIVVYSLTDFLESSTATAGNIDALKKLIKDTKGKVFFYTSNGYEPAKGFEFLKKDDYQGCIVTPKDLGSKIKEGGVVVYMVNDLDRRSLGIGDVKLGELIDNKVLIPLNGQRELSKDIFLGLEIVRNNGNPAELPSIFEKMLKDMIKEYLDRQGKAPTPERIRAIYEAEPLPQQIKDSYEAIKKVIISA